MTIGSLLLSFCKVKFLHTYRASVRSRVFIRRFKNSHSVVLSCEMQADTTPSRYVSPGDWT